MYRQARLMLSYDVYQYLPCLGVWGWLGIRLVTADVFRVVRGSAACRLYSNVGYFAIYGWLFTFTPNNQNFTELWKCIMFLLKWMLWMWCPKASSARVKIAAPKTLTKTKVSGSPSFPTLHCVIPDLIGNPTHNSNKITIMKKISILLLAALTLAACQKNETPSTSNEGATL